MSTIRSTVRFSRHATNGVTLHVAEAGPADGRLVVLLHGFPEFWYGWRHQIDALADAGYRVVVPDQRGYNLSDKPKGRAAYDIDHLARDVVGLVDGIGRQTFRLVGHDWGAGVGWWIALRHPERLERFVALSAPHPAVWIDAMRNNPEQRKKSWYVRAFRIPWLPEFLLRQRNFKGLADALRESRRPGACSDEDLAKYREAWSRPGALTGMINWYRALLAKPVPPTLPGPVKVPTLIVWGRDDKYGIPELAERSGRLCDDGPVVYLDATHWVQHDEPERVNELLLEFLAGPASGTPQLR
jgi:pimeloyl-ACP methyl ester carboxylesterase